MNAGTKKCYVTPEPSKQAKAWNKRFERCDDKQVIKRHDWLKPFLLVFSYDIISRKIVLRKPTLTVNFCLYYQCYDNVKIVLTSVLLQLILRLTRISNVMRLIRYCTYLKVKTWHGRLEDSLSLTI